MPFALAGGLCSLKKHRLRRSKTNEDWNVFNVVFITVLSFEIIFCRENFISITAGDIDCNLSLFYLLKDNKKAADNFSITDLKHKY